MTTPVPEQLVQLHNEVISLRERLRASILKHERFSHRRLPATTKLNLSLCLTSLREAEKHLTTALVAFLGDVP